MIFLHALAALGLAAILLGIAWHGVLTWRAPAPKEPAPRIPFGLLAQAALADRALAQHDD
jgi:hypothetical protein